jgi:hypothetical protein
MYLAEIRLRWKSCLLPAFLLAALALPWSSSAGAATFFYDEIVKDNTIYVFADHASFEQFEATGEVGGDWITRESYGPRGETVVFDSDAAVGLYNYKHDLPGETFEVKEEKKYPSGKFSGLMFGDFYDFETYYQDNAPGTETPVDGQYGFWMRRIYFTYDVAFSDKITSRFRIEANSNGKFQGGNLDPYVKDAWIKWTYTGKQQVTLGIQPSLTFDWIEGFWGLRHIEKTPADLYKIDSSRDFGIKFSGPVFFDGLSYAFQFGNDSGNGSETDKYKVYRVEGRYDRKTGFGANVVYDNSNRDDDADRETWSGFAGYRTDTWRVGGNYITQDREAKRSSEDQRTQNIEIWSLFGVWEFLPDKASLFARYDDVSGDLGGETTGLPGAEGIDYWMLSSREPFQTYILGGEWYILPKVRLSPNVEWAKYDNDPDPILFPGRDEERIYRLTFFWSW